MGEKDGTESTIQRKHSKLMDFKLSMESSSFQMLSRNEPDVNVTFSIMNMNMNMRRLSYQFLKSIWFSED